MSGVKQFGVRPRAYKVDDASLDLINEQEITADMAFPVIFPISLERVILPLRTKKRVVGDQQHHGFPEPMHVVPAGA